MSLSSTITPTVIHTTGLTKAYGRVRALEPTSISIPQGSIFALLGPNGAGKTTLIKLLVNILRPSGGHAVVLDQLSSEITGDAFMRIGYVSENQDLPDWMTVAAFLKYQSGFYPQWDDAELIRSFDLPLTRKLKHLSRGQRMKVALASVLAFRPALIVLDEPFSGLDPLVRDELIEALLDTVATQPTTILLSSHDLTEVESFATDVAFLQKGRLVLCEEMALLSARFREVSFALVDEQELRVAEVSEPVAVPPKSWSGLKRSGHALRFVHAQANTEPIEQQIKLLYPNAAAISIEPMNLRSIFLAIASSGRITRHDEGSRL